MKYIIGIIQPDRLDEVLKRLTEQEIHLVTVSNVLGRGRQRGIAEVYRSHKEQGSLLKKVKLEIAVNEAFVEKTIEAITGGAQSGQIGDGKIFVLDLPECVRIRTGERGGDAIGSSNSPSWPSITSSLPSCRTHPRDEKIRKCIYWLVNLQKCTESHGLAWTDHVL